MSGDQEQVPSSLRRRIRGTKRWMWLIIAGLVIASIGILPVVLANNASTASPRPPDEPPFVTGDGCMIYDNDIRTWPGQVQVVDVEITFTSCSEALGPQEFAKREPTPEDVERELLLQMQLRAAPDTAGVEAKRALAQYLEWELLQYEEEKKSRTQALVGGQAELLLVSPLFAGKIEPVSVGPQAIDSIEDRGTWAWQVRPDQPGDYEISLVLKMRNKDNADVELTSERVRVFMRVEGTPSYYLGAAGSFITDMLTKGAGVVVGLVTAIVAVLGLRARLSGGAKKITDQEPSESNQSNASNADGYM